jgi:bifunctional enzyme CysN/CysC
VAEVVLETPKPVAFDAVGDVEQTGRLVIVDNYEIAGAGIVLAGVTARESTLQEHIRAREIAWRNSAIPKDERTAAYGHGGKFIVFTSADGAVGEAFAQALERKLFAMHYKAYYLGMENVTHGLDADLREDGDVRDDHIRRLGELARILTDSGQIFITSISNVDDYDLKTLELLNTPNEILTVNVGESTFARSVPNLNLDGRSDVGRGVEAVCALLREKKVILDYQI